MVKLLDNMKKTKNYRDIGGIYISPLSFWNINKSINYILAHRHLHKYKLLPKKLLNKIRSQKLIFSF